MLRDKAYKFRVYPDIEQEILINKAFSYTRFIYNNVIQKEK